MAIKRIGGQNQLIRRSSKHFLDRDANCRGTLTFAIQRLVRHTTNVHLRSSQERQPRSSFPVLELRTTSPINMENTTSDRSVLTPRINSTYTLNHSGYRLPYLLQDSRIYSAVSIRRSFATVVVVRSNCNARGYEFPHTIPTGGNDRLSSFRENVSLVRGPLLYMTCKGVTRFCRAIVSLLHGAARAAVKVPDDTMVTFANGIGVLRAVSREDGATTPREEIPNEDAQ